ncbi:hypothetical protein [Streptomyces sp. UNOC14_S4]|uniref:hypothetical protein n=1 Tax=Streptomyces sp. UNOC14_S4 TaxID=2872340 RepID=UPI001E60A383|nr:hypothetical protein [Streptomyces sp. UNOC14_S4]MCC3767656.1 hypothetical protein [Streptomyces sp. UNOC14_S4]
MIPLPHTGGPPAMPTDRDGNPCGVCALLRRAMGTAVRRGDSAALAKYLTTEKRHYARMHPGYGP